MLRVLIIFILVYAQLIIDGKEYGVHVYMLQIRDENHRPFKGIELGDLGIIKYNIRTKIRRWRK
jgi:hypothetical protein